MTMMIKKLFKGNSKILSFFANYLFKKKDSLPKVVDPPAQSRTYRMVMGTSFLLGLAISQPLMADSSGVSSMVTKNENSKKINVEIHQKNECEKATLLQYNEYSKDVKNTVFFSNASKHSNENSRTEKEFYIEFITVLYRREEYILFEQHLQEVYLVRGP